MILNYSADWYQFTTVVFRPRTSSMTSARPWLGGTSVYGPHAHAWIGKFSADIIEERDRRDLSAFFAQLGGPSGLLRIGDPSRMTCFFNRNRMPEQQPASDGTFSSDGTGFIDGLMPPKAHLLDRASQGASFVKIGGLLPLTRAALNRGDLLEFRVNGRADEVPRLHEVVSTGNTDADGRTGVRIVPPLRSGLAVGDQVVLEDPRSIFHVVDDDQGEMEVTYPTRANFAFQIIEAVENV